MTKDAAKLFIAVSLACLFANAAGAEESARRTYVQGEYWIGGDAYDADRAEVVDLVEDPSTPYTQGKSEVGSGFGFRAGFVKPVDTCFWSFWGANFGLIRGPSGKFDVNNGVPTTQLISYRSRTIFGRVLVEAGKDVSLGQRMTLKLGVGVGAAHGNITIDGQTRSGSVVRGLSGSEGWTGFSWELSPSLLIESGKTDVEVGLMVAGFPTLKESKDIEEFGWAPVGVKIGVHF